MQFILISGSNGLIGSEAVEYFDREGRQVVGVDNNIHREFFGPPRPGTIRSKVPFKTILVTR
jgi:nucleoside-diphosphate-sugar epimerase